MDGFQFDRLTRSLTAIASRRGVLRGFAIGLFGASTAHHSRVATAGKGKRKLKRNRFGCVNVGGKCRGKDKHCCSNICQGKTPKKGQRDRSRCVAHDASTCQPRRTDVCALPLPSCVTSTGYADGKCWTTTGKAGYCSADAIGVSCARDVDCQKEYGPKAACAVCGSSPGGTACVQPDDIL